MLATKDLVEIVKDIAKNRISWVSCKTSDEGKPIQKLKIGIRPRYLAKEIPSHYGIMQNPKPHSEPWGGLKVRFENGKFWLPRAAIDKNASSEDREEAEKILGQRIPPISLTQAQEIYDHLENPDTRGFNAVYQRDPLCNYWREFGKVLPDATQERRYVVAESDRAKRLGEEVESRLSAEAVGDGDKANSGTTVDDGTGVAFVSEKKPRGRPPGKHKAY